MDLNKASEVYDFYLEEIEKAKYSRRYRKGNKWVYEYPDEKKGRSEKKVVEKPASKVTNKKESENGESKMRQSTKTAIEELTQENMKLYKDLWEDTNFYSEYAKDLWDARTDAEIERDEDDMVSLKDYENIVHNVFVENSKK